MSIFYLAGKSHLVEVYDDEALDLSCCGNPLKELKPNTVDAAQEKHVPVPTYDAAKHEVTGHARYATWCAAYRPYGGGCTDRYVPPCGR